MSMEADEEFDSRNSMQGTGGTSSTRPSSSNLLKHLTALKRKGKLSPMTALKSKAKKTKGKSVTTPSAVSKVVAQTNANKSAKPSQEQGRTKFVFKKA